MTDRPRIGIVGLGNIGGYHASSLESNGAEFTAGLDVDPAARTRFEREYNIDCYEDVDELLAAVDAVIVTTPNRFHEEYAVAALEAGVPLYLEKPLAHTLESAERIAEAAAASDAIAYVGFHNRYSGGAEVVDGLRRQGQFGDPTHVEIEYVRRRGIPGLGSWFTSTEVAGGGALIDIGVHAIDIGLHLAGFPEIVEVSGMTRSTFGGREDYADVETWAEAEGEGEFTVDDSASAFLRAADGTTVSLEVAWASNRPANMQVRLRGTEAGAEVELGSSEATVFDSGTAGLDHHATTTFETEEIDAHAASQAAFVDAVRTGVQPERNTIEQALEVQRVVDAIYRSSEQGRAIRLDG